jgi:RecB family exonuclease
MAEAYSVSGGRRVTATDLRRGPLSGDSASLIRSLSPLAGSLRGQAVDYVEVALRQAVTLRKSGGQIDGAHARWPAVQMLRARRSGSFTEWDGNVAALSETDAFELTRAVSPTSLEHYAACGFRYFCKSVLRLNTVEEPGEREIMDPATRGSLMHDVLDRFYREKREAGRPAVREQWNEEDHQWLLAILDEELAAARARGLAGLPIYSRHEARNIRADLLRFLDEDSVFRLETGAVPVGFEQDIPEQQVGGVTLRGRVDRIDKTPDGSRAWVIDYKTGKSDDYKGIENDPLGGGRRLQLPVYISAVQGASDVTALYWFITQRGGFDREKKYEPTPERDQQFRSTIEAIVSGVRSGAFPAYSGEESDFYEKFDNCSWCDFDRICSRRRDAEFDAKHEDDAMGPWHAVARAAAPREEA